MSLEGLDGGNCGIACTADGSLLAVSNQLSYTITMYSSADGALVRTFGVKGAGEGEFDSPRGLLFTPTPASSLLVAEDDNLRVQEVSVTGEHLRFIGVGVIDGPIVSVALCGDTLAVGKGYEASGDQIMLFCFSTGACVWCGSSWWTVHRTCLYSFDVVLASGALLSSFASYGSEPGEISTATGVTASVFATLSVDTVIPYAYRTYMIVVCSSLLATLGACSLFLFFRPLRPAQKCCHTAPVSIVCVETVPVLRDVVPV